MTDAKKKYNALLQEIGDMIQRKNAEILLLKHQVEMLEVNLQAAEQHSYKNANIETR